MQSLPQESFAGGEIAPALWGRTDWDRYGISLKQCKDWLVMPYGGLKNRSGTLFQGEVADSSKSGRLIPFVYSSDQTCILEFGDLSFRVIKNGAVVATVVAPWALADLPLLKTTQSADVVTVCHPNYPPHKISRLSETSWTVTAIDFVNGPFDDINTDTSLTIYASAVSGTVDIFPSAVGLFTAADVGKLLYVGQKDAGRAWIPLTAVTTNTIRRANGKYWACLASGTTGTDRPGESDSRAVDDWNDGAVDWRYIHSGFGIAKITGIDPPAYSSSVTYVNNDVVRSAGVNYWATQGGTNHTPASSTSYWTPILSWDMGAGYGNGSMILHAGELYRSSQNWNTGHVPNESPDWWELWTGTVPHIPRPAAATVLTRIPDEAIVIGGKTHKWAKGTWNDLNGYPSCTTYFQQRQAFGGSPFRSQTVWLSRSADYPNFGTSVPSLDDDALTYPLVSNQVNAVRHLVGLGHSLVAFASDSITTLTGSDSQGALTPNSVQAKPQGTLGSSHIAPILVGNSTVYIQDKGQSVHDLMYDYSSDAYVGDDLSTFAPHLLEGFTIVGWAYQCVPYSILWLVRSDGALLGLTYVRSQKCIAWHQHNVGGAVESICCVSEGNEDAIHLLVRRTINGSVVRYRERMANRQIADIDDAHFVDSGIVVNGWNTTGTTVYLSPNPLTPWLGGVGNWLGITNPWTNGLRDGDIIVLFDSAGVRYEIALGVVGIALTPCIPNRDIPDELIGVHIAAWGVSRSIVTGLDHLEGETVSILSDGNAVAQQVVTNGSITLNLPGVVVHVGLPIQAELTLLDPNIPGKETIRNREKSIAGVDLMVEATRGLCVGFKEDASEVWEEWKQPFDENNNNPTEPFTGLAEIPIATGSTKNLVPMIRQYDPLPASVLSVTLRLEIGGV